MKVQSLPNQSGYIALVSVILVMSAVLIIGGMVTIVAANQLLTTFTADRGLRAWYIADTCANEALLRIKRTGTAYVGTHSLTLDTDASCTITATQNGTVVTAEVTGQFRTETYHTITVTVETSTFAVTNWQEGS